MGPDEPEQPPEELVEEREGHGRAAGPTASELVKPDMGVIGPFTLTSATGGYTTATEPARSGTNARSPCNTPSSTETTVILKGASPGISL
jgi:hypothetical protein